MKRHSRPVTPSMGTRCSQSQCHGSSPNTAGRNRSASNVPVQRSHAEPLGRECIHVQPRPPSQSGRRNAVRPMLCSSRSLSHAPKSPTQLPIAREPASPVAVFSDGSVACQVAMERKRSRETSSSSTPRNTFRGRLRVGERTIETGFMAFALPLGGLLRSLPRTEPKERPKSPRATFIVGVRKADSGSKGTGGIRLCTPPKLQQIALWPQKCNPATAGI